jgi:multiple sugar transport system permease protein
MRTLNKKITPYLYMLPAVILVAAVSFFPLFYALRQSLYETHYLKLREFIGFQNYTKLFVQEAGFRFVTNSFIHVFGTLFLTLPIAFLLALLLNGEFRGRSFFRSALILPWTVSQLIGAFLWVWLLNPYYSPISYVLYSSFGIAMPNLPTSEAFAMPTLVHVTSWRYYPIALIFILASLQTIEPELHEAAKIDGASNWQRFRVITFPLIKNTVLVSVVLITLYVFNLVTVTLILTGGGPGNATRTLAFKAFEEGIKFWHIGFGAAIAAIIFFFNVIFSLVYLKLLKVESYN